MIEIDKEKVKIKAEVKDIRFFNIICIYLERFYGIPINSKVLEFIRQKLAEIIYVYKESQK